VSDTQLLILPFYVVADVSYSMTQATGDGGSPLASVNGIVPALRDAIESNPILKDKVRFSLIDFSDDARTQIPLCDIMTIQNASIPQLVARGGTSYSAAFRTTKDQLDADVRQLKADGHKVHRPAVFFITDGEPSDPDNEWQQAFAELTDSGFNARPNFIPFGMGDAKKDVIDQLVYPQGKMRSFVAREGADAAAAVKSMAEKLIGSVIASAMSVDKGGESGGFVLADEDEDDGMWL
jgi:uncharacterized protein YegL